MHVLGRVFSCLVRKSLYTLYNIINDIILVQLDFATIFPKKKQESHLFLKVISSQSVYITLTLKQLKSH